MAKIDPNKFIPQNKTENKGLSSQRVSVSSGISNTPSSNLNPSDVKLDGNENQPKTLLSEVVNIRKNVLSILKLVRSNSSLLKKSEERKRKEEEKKKFEEKELRSEEKKNKLIPDFKPTEFPKMGFLDRIKQFLFYTVLGAAFTKFGKHIPKVLNFLKLLGPAFKTLEDLTGNILNGFVDFIGFGYKAYDQVKKIIVGISGDDTEKRLKEFDAQFNKFANLALIAGMAAAGSVDFGSGGGGKKERLGVDKQTGQRVSKRTQARYLSQYGEEAYVKKFGKRSYKGLTGKTAGRFGGRLAGKALGRVPIIGGLVDFIISTVIFKEKPGRAAAKAVGATIGSALGTFVPVPFAGTILGGILGDLVGGALYDSLVGGDKLKGKAKGGQVTRGGKSVSTPIRRTVKRAKARPPRIKPQRTIPGKDIGGRKKIEELFPSPTDPRKKNPLGVLETASKNYKERVPLIGSIMGAALDSTMGQRPDPRTFKKIGTGFGYLIQNAIDAETNGTIASVQNQIVGLANGGVVPRTLSTNENIGMKIGESIGKTLEAMVNSQVNGTLQSIRQQFTKEDYTTPGGGGGEYDDGGDAGDFSGNSKAMKAFNYFKSQGYTDFQSAAIVGNLLQENRAMDPTLANSIGMKGIAQWDKNRWSNLERFSKNKGLDPNTFEAQLQFIQYELKTGDGGLSASVFKGTKNLEEATVMFRKKYERPGEAEANDAARIKYARSVLNTSSGKGTKGPEAMVTGGVKPSQIPQTSPQGWRWGKMHKGIDLNGGDNAPISSAQDAKVIFAGDKNDGYGNTVILKYSNGAETRFAHLNKMNVRSGQQIKAGQLIGTQGNTGNSYGSHLHFEYYPNGGALSYKGYGNAASVKDSYFRYGGNVKPKVLPKPADPANKPGSISGAVTGYGKVGNAEYFYANKKYWERKDGKTNEITSRTYAAIRTNHPSGFGIAPTVDANKLKLPGGGYRPESDYQASLAPTQIPDLASGVKSQTSYEVAGGFTFFSRTTIIEKQVPTPTGGGVVNNTTTSSSFNQIQASLASA